MMHPMGCKIIIVMEMRLVVLRLPRQEGYLQEAGAKELETGNDIVQLAPHILLQEKSGDGDTESLQSQSFCVSGSFSVSVMSL
jgi:hypothetical protein